MEGENISFTVSELSAYIKDKLESDSFLQNAYISGEVSNKTIHRSGHMYFTLKDKDAQISCVIFRFNLSRNFFIPDNGDAITAIGDISIYPPHGKYQLVVHTLLKEGKGDLYQKFLMLKEKLRAESLFDQKHKKNLPKFPKKIGIATSATGAAIHDMLNILKKRFPAVEVMLVPAQVQGIYAKDSIIRSLEILDDMELDLIICGRGGGSIEDLWSFNEEEVARKIFEMKTPIISAVGHETDFTIADFVADARAETPTAAAVMAVPDQSEILRNLDFQFGQMSAQVRSLLNFQTQRLDDFLYKITKTVQQKVQQERSQLENVQFVLTHRLESYVDLRKKVVESVEKELKVALNQKLRETTSELKTLNLKLNESMNAKLQNAHKQLTEFQHQLELNDIQSTLERGFTLTYQNGKLLRSKTEISDKKPIETIFHDGKVESEIKK